MSRMKRSRRDGQITTWDVTYVGCDARQSGTFQGEMISDLGLDTVDLNGNGKIDYVMVEGDRRTWIASIVQNIL